MCVVLAEDGQTDFYYNFRLVEQNKNKLTEDISYDFTFIYLLSKEYDEEKPDEELKKELDQLGDGVSIYTIDKDTTTTAYKKEKNNEEYIKKINDKQFFKPEKLLRSVKSYKINQVWQEKIGFSVAD